MKKKTIGIVSLLICLSMIATALPSEAYSQNMDKTNHKITQADLDNNTAPLSTDWYHVPPNIATLMQWYQALDANYSNYMEIIAMNQVYNTGTITGGYQDYYIRITNESTGITTKPEVLFLGNVHGNENQGTVGDYWFIDWLMRMAFTDQPCAAGYDKAWLRWLIDNRVMYFEVSHNPYGYDHDQREDANGWDLNREADLDGPGYPTGGIWASCQGKTLVAFVNNHTVRIAQDWHSGARLLLYPWGSTHSSVHGVSPITGRDNDYAPPDFYFYDVFCQRLGAYTGDYGGDFDPYSIGTIPGTVGYVVQGGMGPWAYGANPTFSPLEQVYVDHGPYPGAGILWISPEMGVYTASESQFGNDTVNRFGAEVRRIILHQTDLAQPNIQIQSNSIPDDSVVTFGNAIPIYWMVNGSLVVDHTSIQWGHDPDPITHPEFVTTDHNENDGNWIGGTGWEGANDGHTHGVTYSENLTPTTPGDYYFVIKAQVDQKYAQGLHPEIYGTNSYSRAVMERTNDSFYEQLDGNDGTETIQGHTWWYSPIIHVVITGSAPAKPSAPAGQQKGKTKLEYNYTTSTTDVDENETLFYQWDWGDGNVSTWIGPYVPGAEASATHAWQKWGNFNVKVRAKDKYGLMSEWSDPSPVRMPYAPSHPILEWLFAHFPNLFPLLRHLYG